MQQSNFLHIMVSTGLLATAVVMAGQAKSFGELAWITN